MKHHTQSYVICATPRSGTTLLCDLLDDTGIAGRSDSFFRLQAIPRWAQTVDVPVEEWSDEHAFDRAFLSAVLRAGRGSTQVFGMRLMWEQANNLAKRLDALYPALSSDSAGYSAAFGPICFFHLSRSDKDARAVSLIKAEQTGLWHVHTDGSERERVKPAQAPAYDAQVLSAQVAELERHDAAWANWFVQQQIRPVRITYEAL